MVFALNQIQHLAALFCIPAQTVNVDRIYLIEKEVNERPLNSIICPWMLKLFTMANVDHKPKFLYSHQFWLEIYSGCHLHLFTAWLMCSRVVCSKNLEWLGWLSPMGSLPFEFLPSLSNSRAFSCHVPFVCSEQNFSCTITQERSNAVSKIHKSLWNSCLPSTGRNPNHWMISQTTQYFFPPILPSLPSQAQVLFELWRSVF